VGVYNSLLGKSYGEIASESRSQHKSQGFGIARQRGQAFEYFDITAGDAPKNSLMEGVDTTWARTGSSDIPSQVDNILRTYNFEYPENSVPALVSLYQSIQRLPQQYWREKKLEEVKKLIMECSGLFAEATTNNEYAIQGDQFNLQLSIDKRGMGDVVLKAIQMGSFDSSINRKLPDDQNINIYHTFNVPVDAKISQPYWLEKPLQSGSFDVTDQQLIGKAENDPAYKASVSFTINNVDFTIDLPVQYRYTDPVKGEVYQPFRVVPPITGSFDQPLYVLDGAKEKQVEFHLQTKKKFNEVNVHLTSGKDWKIEGGNFNDSLKKDAEQDAKAIITTSTNSGSTDIGVVTNKIIEEGNIAYDQALLDEHKISYEHIPPVIYYTPLSAKAEKISIVIKGKNIGYIPGAGDKVPQALEQMGYNVTFLHPNNITDGSLQQFDAVIAGVRTYNVNDWMNSKYDVLMRYVQNGGNYIVQYNTAGFAPTKMKIGPYDFAIARTRVTDENADVHILLPNHTALNFPNKITARDFEGWIQERSIYQGDQLDSHYEALFGMHDKNEAESNGSLIVAKYGKGNFVYTGLVFFRELPAGVPGAYRLMANLIALPKNK
jgi:hypothetical protein